MTSTRDRNGSSGAGFGLQDFGALSATDLKSDAAIRIVAPDVHDRLAAQTDAQVASSMHVDRAGAPAHAATAPDVLRHIPLTQSQNVSHATSAGGAIDLNNGQHLISVDHSQSLVAAADHEFVSDTLAEQANFNLMPTSNAAFEQSNLVHDASANSRGSDFSFGGSGHETQHAPPPIGAVGGQLWFGGEGVSADDGAFHIDSDAAGRDVADLTTAHVSFENVGLDGASGLYFGITADGLLRSGHITNDQETGEASQTSTVDMIFGSGPSADEVQALAIDPLNHIIFVGLWGQSDSTTSILEVQYNPTTGALTSPYNASTGAITDLNHVLLHDDNAGHAGGVNFTNPIAMQYDMQNGNLYYVDQTNGTSFAGGAGTTWQATNGIYVVSTTGTVGGGTAPTPVQLSLNSQFAGGDNNNYIEGLAINEAQGIIYFNVNNASNSTSKLFWMPIAGGTATQITLPGSFFADNNLAGVNSISFDPNLRQLYISDNAHSKIIQVTLDAAGHVASSTNMSFMDFDSGVGGSSATGLYFDPLPTLSALTATTTEAVQGGSAISLLTAAPSISDAQDGASNKLHMGYLQVVVANAQAGDNLYYSGAQSGSFDSGKMTISWNSTTHTLTLTGNETEAFYDTLFQNISFQDSGTDNSTGSHPTRTIDWIISDGTTVVDQTTADPNEKATTVVIDRAPTLTADSYAVLESATSSGTSGTAGTGVLGNDNDKDADAIIVTAVQGSGANVGNSVSGTYGHLTLNANGSYSYVADNMSNIDNAANGSHPVDTFTYTVSDGLGGVTTTTVSFTIDRAPTVVADGPAGQALEAGSPVTGNVLTNDSDKDGDTLTVSAVNGSGGSVGISVAGTYGHMTINANGSYSYSADSTAAIDGAATGSHLTDTFTYTASDGHGGTTSTTITVTLDRAPTDVSDSGAAVESFSGTGNVLTNDSDRDGDTLAVSAVNGSGGNVGISVAGTYGHITINANGSYTYNADNTAAIDGAATGSHLTDTFTYTASDGHGGTTTTSVTITLDRAPTVVVDSGAAVEGSSGAGNVLTNDSDRDGDTLVVSAVNGSGGNVGNSVATTYGHITINADGSYSYTADNTAAIDGAATGSHLTDTVSYTASDGHGGTTTTNIVITLDRAPTVVADSGAALEGSSGTGNVLTNDSDRDGDSLVVSAVNGSGGGVGVSVAGTYGEITINANGSYSYAADNIVAIDGAATGSHLTDTFTYTASDGHGGTTTASIVITLDRGPTAVNDSFGSQVVEGGSTGAVSAANGVLHNDSDRDGDTLVVSAIGGGSVGGATATTYGHITLNADGSYSYTADNTAAIDGAATGAHLTDTVSFTVSDGHGGTASETLSITLDRLAVATGDSLSTTETTQAVSGSGGNANLLANDTDRDGDAIVITQVNGSAGHVGSQFKLASGAFLTVNADGTYTYDPHNAFNYLAAAGSGASDTTATDTFTYTIDGGSMVTVTITIAGVDGNDVLIGTTGIDTIHGGAGADIFFDDNGARSGIDARDTSAGHSGGNDALSGDIGNDRFFMGANLTAGVSIDGGTGNDRVFLDGDYTSANALVFTSTTMVNVEALSLAAGNSYSLTTDDATVAAGKTLTIQAGTLGVGDNVTFDGGAETNGRFVINTGAGNDALTGGGGNDIFRSGAGTDTIHAGGGNDTINMGANLTAADTIDGGSGHDTLELAGDYSSALTFGSTTMTNIEMLQLKGGFDYDLILNGLNVTSGQTLSVKAISLGAGDNLTFDASAVTGNVVISSGAGNDTLSGGSGDDVIKAGAGTNLITGNGGADTLTGGSGHDTFVYNQAADSTSTAYDRVVHFDADNDTFQINGFPVNAIDTAVTRGVLNLADFDTDLAGAITGTELGAHDAILFTANRGDLHGHTFLIVDLNGTAGYQAGQDLVIDITGAANLNNLTTTNFTH